MKTRYQLELDTQEKIRRAEGLSYLSEAEIDQVIENAREQERNYIGKVEGLLSVLSQITLNK